MARHVPWLRLLAEGVAIVVSILLAFAIQAWWEGRQLEEARVELLSTMLESVRLNRASLAENLAGSESNQRRAATFYSLPDSALSSVQRDTAAAFLIAIGQPNTVQFSDGPLSGLLDASRLGLIEDRRVLTEIDRWGLQVQELDERGRSLSDANRGVMDGLGAHEVYQRWQFLSPGVQGSTPGLRRFSNEGLPARVDLRVIRNDPAVMGPATTLAAGRRVYLRFADDLGETLRRLEELLGSLVDETR